MSLYNSRDSPILLSKALGFIVHKMITKNEHESVSIAADLEQRDFKGRVISCLVKIINSLLPGFVAIRSR